MYISILKKFVSIGNYSNNFDKNDVDYTIKYPTHGIKENI